MAERNKNHLGFWGTIFIGGVLLFKESLAWGVGKAWDWVAGNTLHGMSGPMTGIYQSIDLWKLVGVALIALAIWSSYRDEIRLATTRLRWHFFPGVRLVGGIGLMRAGDHPVQVQGLSLSLQNFMRHSIKDVRGYAEFMGSSERVKLELVEKDAKLEDVAEIPVGVNVSLHCPLPPSVKPNWENFLTAVSSVMVVVECDGRTQILHISKADMMESIDGFRGRTGNVTKQALLKLKGESEIPRLPSGIATKTPLKTHRD